MSKIESWKDGQAVKGTYCGVPYVGKIKDDGSAYCSRRAHRGNTFIFVVTLNSPIQVFGQERHRVEIWSNCDNSNSIELA